MPEVDDPVLAMERADEAYAALDVEGLITHLSSAIRGFTAAGDPLRAAMACVRLGDVQANVLGHLTAARTWFARATRLVADLPPCVEQGWVALAALGCEVDDPIELLARAEVALARARQFGDLNLETKALADGGLAHVQAGRVAEGMAMLDEAMALACGPADDVDAAAKSVCSFLTACCFTADFERASRWADLLRRHGLIGPQPPGPVFLSGHCDSVQATLLMELGRWGEAEAVLVGAIDLFERTMGSPSWHPAIVLADLRTRQGRFADAEALLLGKDQAIEALLPMARLHLERGDAELAVAAAERGLRALGTDQLRAAALLTLLVNAHVARGDHAGARDACQQLQERLEGLEVPALHARAEVARARLLAATGERDGAVAVVRAVLEGVDPRQLPWLRVTLLLQLAQLRADAGDPEAAGQAAAEARRALAGLDVVLTPGAAALLDRLAPGSAGVAPPPAATLHRDGTWWSLTAAGTTVRLRDSKGLRYLAELVVAAGTERHALDLVDRLEGVGGAGQPDRRSLGDAGELLDPQARTAYRRRIEALRADADDALAEGRLDDAEAVEDELDSLVAQLAGAFGLGGRSRVAASAAERARLNVTRALRAALAKVTEALPEAGATLDRRVRTGLYCAYEPVDGEVRWIVQP